MCTVYVSEKERVSELNAIKLYKTQPSKYKCIQIFYGFCVCIEFIKSFFVFHCFILSSVFFSLFFPYYSSLYSKLVFLLLLFFLLLSFPFLVSFLLAEYVSILRVCMGLVCKATENLFDSFLYTVSFIRHSLS